MESDRSHWRMAKASKQRPCPAISGNILSAECGAGRNSRYKCPPDCGYNPLGIQNYGQLLAIEDGLDAKAARWIGREDPARNPKLVDRVDRARAESSGHGIHATFAWHLFFLKDSSGSTCAQRWEQAGFPGLNNDERNLFRAKMQTRIMLIEVQRVLDHERLEAIDRLAADSTPMILVDRSMAARAARFSTLLSWAFPMPHFWRLSGSVVSLTDMGPFSPAEILAETIRHLGGPGSPEEDRLWLAENFVRVERAITATANERLRRMYAMLDASWGHAIYDLHAPFAECRAALDREPAVEPALLEESERAEKFTEARTWFDDSPEARAIALNQGRPLLGTVLLRPGSWKIQASSGSRLDQLRKLFEQRLGNRVQFSRERRDDLGTRLAENVPATSDPDIIVPRLLEHVHAPAFSISKMPISPSASPAALSELVRGNEWKTFPDEPVPALDGHTPREAASNPALRPRLIQLMKSHVRGVDEENLQKGGHSDINPLLRELGLHEIDFPPPPRRTSSPRDHERDSGEDDEDEISNASSRARPVTGPVLPPLPRDRPLTADEAEARVQAAIAGFERAGDALEAISASGSTIVDDLLQVTDGLIEEHDFHFLVPFLISIWFVLVPAGSRAPLLPRETLRKALRRDLGLMTSTADLEKVPDWLIQNRRQPALTLYVMGNCTGNLPRVPKNMRPRPEVQTVIGLILATVIEELDRAVRG